MVHYNLCTNHFFPSNLIYSCLVGNRMFHMKQYKFQVQNVLFVMHANPVYIKQLFNSARNCGCFGNTAIVEGHVGCPPFKFLPIITQTKTVHSSLL